MLDLMAVISQPAGVTEAAVNDNELELEPWTSCEGQLWRWGTQLAEEGDHVAANYLFRLCIRRRDAHSSFALAHYYNNVSIPRDRAQAAKLLKQAARWGHPSAAWNLAMDYRLRGCRRWYVHWLQVAARLGDEDAPDALMQLEANGDAWWRLPGIDDPPTLGRDFRPDVIDFTRPRRG